MNSEKSLNLIEANIYRLNEKIENLSSTIEECLDLFESDEVKGKLRERLKGLRKKQKLEKTKDFLKKKYPLTFKLLEEIDDYLYALQDNFSELENIATTAVETINETIGVLEEVEDAKQRL